MPESLFYQIILRAGPAEYDLSSDISSLTWDQNDELPDRLTLQVPDPYKVLSHALREGTHVEFAFGTDVRHPIVFRGRIYAVTARIAPSGLQTLTVRAEDRAAELGLKRFPGRTFKNEPLSAVVTKILESYEFSKKTVSVGPDPKLDIVVQHDESDLEFLQELARTYGCTMFVSQGVGGEEINFVGLASLVALPPSFVFAHGRLGVDNTLTEFQGQVDARRAQNRVIIKGKETDSEPIDPKAPPEPVDPFFEENIAAIQDQAKVQRLKTLIQNASVAAGEVTMLKNGTGGAQDQILYRSGMNADELKMLRENWISVNALGMTGDGTCAGLPDLRARAMIELNDVGGRFSGRWYVSEVVHTLGGEGFDTRFHCKR